MRYRWLCPGVICRYLEHELCWRGYGASGGLVVVGRGLWKRRKKGTKHGLTSVEYCVSCLSIHLGP
jgi:hypothetical protein